MAFPGLHCHMQFGGRAGLILRDGRRHEQSIAVSLGSGGSRRAPSLQGWKLEVSDQRAGGFSRAKTWGVRWKQGPCPVSKAEGVEGGWHHVGAMCPTACMHGTYPRPPKWQELPFGPIVSFDEEESSNHDEDPDCQVNDVEHVVQPHRVLYSHGHDDGDNDSNDQSKKVRVRLLSLPWVREKSCVTLRL